MSERRCLYQPCDKTANWLVGQPDPEAAPILVCYAHVNRALERYGVYGVSYTPNTPTQGDAG